MSLITDAMMKVMVVDDDAVDRRHIMRHLSHFMPNVVFSQAESFEAAKQVFDEEAIDFVLSDYRLPDGNGLDVIEHIMRISQFMPIVLLTSYGDENLAIQAMHVGACDYLNKDKLDEDRVKQAIENSIQRRSLEAKVYDLAHFDTLTKLHNRAHFDERLTHTLQRAERYGTHIAVMFMDLNGFKQVNDTYGHDVGDKVLVEVAKRLKRCVRDVDTVARLGGDEFAVILEELQGDDKECCSVIGTRILEAIRNPFEVEGKLLKIGISVGVAIHAGKHTEPDALMKMADEAMYDAKGATNGEALQFKSAS